MRQPLSRRAVDLRVASPRVQRLGEHPPGRLAAAAEQGFRAALQALEGFDDFMWMVDLAKGLARVEGALAHHEATQVLTADVTPHTIAAIQALVAEAEATV